MSELFYGVVGPDGQLLDVTKSSTEAKSFARDVAGKKTVVNTTSGEESLSRENPPVRKGSALGAFKGTLLPRIRMDEVMRLSPNEAFARFGPILANATKTNRTRTGFMRGMLGQNMKMSKQIVNGLIKALDAPWTPELAQALGEDSITYGLSLAPNTQAWDTPVAPIPLVQVGGRKRKGNLCVFASPECIAGCLVATGQSGLGGIDYRGRKVEKRSVVPAAQATYYKKILLTNMLYHDPVAFCRLLVDALERKRKKYGPSGFAIRLNVFSDIPWEIMFPELFKRFEDVIFYDYTKVPGRKVPDNYHLTFSYSGRNLQACMKHLSEERGVAVVVYGKKYGTDYGKNMPQREAFGISRLHRVDRVWGRPTLNGDMHDARYLDPVVLEAAGLSKKKGYVVSLMYKPPKVVNLIDGGLVGRDRVGAFVVDVIFDEASGMFLAPETPNQTPLGDQ